jgi:hypothetical protein
MALGDPCASYLALTRLDQVETIGDLSFFQYVLAKTEMQWLHVCGHWHQEVGLDFLE